MNKNKKHFITLKPVAVFTAAAITITAGACLSQPSNAKAASRTAVISSIKGNTLKYRKCVNNTRLKGKEDWQWENLVGYGKLKKVTLAKNCRFYFLSMYDLKTLKKTSRKTFKREIKTTYKTAKNHENGVVFYSGMAVKLTIKNGKCTKVVQQYQP